MNNDQYPDNAPQADGAVPQVQNQPQYTPQPSVQQAPVLQQPAQVPPQAGGGVKASLASFFNIQGGADKREFAHGFVAYFAGLVGSVIIAVILFVIGGAIASIEIEEGEASLERPAYVYRSDFTKDLTIPARSNYDTYQEYSQAYEAYTEKRETANKQYEEATKKRTADLEAYQKESEAVESALEAKEGVRDGFAAIFTSIGTVLVALVVMIFGASMYSLLVRRLRDTGMSTKGIVFALLSPIVVAELAMIISQFVAPAAATKAMTSLLMMSFSSFFDALQPLIIINLIAFALIATVTVMTLIICFAKDQSIVKGRGFFQVLKG